MKDIVNFLPKGRNWDANILDETDRTIIEMLIRDGRVPSRLIGSRVSLTDASTGARLKNLVERGYVSIVPQFDWRQAGYRCEAFLFIKVTGASPYDVATQLAEHPEVFASCAGFGDSDVLVILLCPDEQSLLRALSAIRNNPAILEVRIDRLIDCLFWRFFAAKLPYTPLNPMEFPNPVIPLEDIDRQIISILQTDGRASSRKISREVGIGDARVRARLKRLEDANLLRLSALVDPIALGVTVAYVGITTDKNPQAVADHLRANSNFFFAATCIGENEIVATMGYPDEASLQNAVLHTLWRIPNVKRVRKFRLSMIAKSRPDLVRIIVP